MGCKHFHDLNSSKQKNCLDLTLEMTKPLTWVKWPVSRKSPKNKWKHVFGEIHCKKKRKRIKAKTNFHFGTAKCSAPQPPPKKWTQSSTMRAKETTCTAQLCLNVLNPRPTKSMVQRSWQFFIKWCLRRVHPGLFFLDLIGNFGHGTVLWILHNAKSSSRWCSWGQPAAAKQPKSNWAVNHPWRNPGGRAPTKCGEIS